MKTEKSSAILLIAIIFSLVVLGGLFCCVALLPGWFNITTSHWGIKRGGFLLAGIILILASAAPVVSGKVRAGWLQFIWRYLSPGAAIRLRWIMSHRSDLFYHLMEILILLIAVFLFGRTLTCYPGTGDDLHKLGSVYYNPTPLSYFAGDQGPHPSGPNYRPLTTATWWVLQRLFGMSFLPQQIFNFVLHFMNTGLLFLLLRRMNPNRFVVLLLSAVYLFGIYATQVPLDIAHRAGGMVDFWLLLMLLYLAGDFPERVTSLSILSLCGFFLLAFFSRENGVVLPLFVFAIAFLTDKTFQYRKQWMAVSAAALLFYFGLRWAAMGSNLAGYSNYGYLGGVYYYDYPGDLPGLWRYLAYLDVLLKNLAAPVLQGFVEDGGSLLDRARILGWLPMWLSSAAMFGMASSRRLASYQKWALILILLNAGVHFVLFRYRNHDISQLAALIFIAAAPAWSGTSGWRMYVKIGLLVMLLISSISWTWQQSNKIVYRNNWAPAYFGSTDNEYKQHWSNQFERPLVEVILNTCSIPDGVLE